MPHTYSGNKRTKRPDFRPNGKRRLKALQVTVENDRLARVAANELKAKGMSTIPRHEKLAPVTAAELEQQLKKKKKAQETFPEMKRYRALLKLLRQIVVLEEKRESGVVLNDAQIAKVNRFDGLAAELEELQQSLDSSEDEDGVDEDEDEESEGEDDESEGEADEE
ncbi:hypothetical protein FRACYDRAFT_268067 [Fragilariopsis cylindrus CCMP1102]|uniref:Uncharacterized protein n=1 Tax=Fragilariopsis cylindrus CCMP1102 TaxID=635003 RepID=A0A1E7FNH5_9STRA|nr:hypothetical protein FRACYDRAFT_268067 [Fragilariopsis cylindrus CCMP1102]|eukprot:OEU19686.1 hypothetical protein FRACYDRAFT_268067 [Fragilariopsis cylindrus CCMP1102]